jgi:crotonobetainyl-CoA:carnitine CoA-transferase CaiB-like acyl-CoA transferase
MKLDGVRVIDLSLFLPGPQMTLMMADQGAEVIKIENPAEGEPSRHIGLAQAGHTVWFRNTHRGKKSVALNLKTAAGREILLKLAETADVLVESFRPGVVDRLGIAYEVVKRRAPRLVYCSISAFGQHGPLRDKPAHDLAVQALAGTVSLSLGSDAKPAAPNLPSADVTASMVALAGVLMALFRRERTGQGDYVDIAMQDSLMSWLPHATGPVLAEKRPNRPKEERQTGGAAMYHLYETKDGQHVTLGGSEVKFAKTLLGALGRPDLIALCAQPPGAVQDPVKAFFSETFRTKTRDEWTAWFEGRDICFAPVLDTYEAFHQPQVAAREMLVRDPDGVDHIGTPIKFTEEPGQLDFSLPTLGEHTRAVLQGAGYSDADIDAFHRQGAF